MPRRPAHLRNEPKRKPGPKSQGPRSYHRCFLPFEVNDVMVAVAQRDGRTKQSIFEEALKDWVTKQTVNSSITV